ncbi:uncharacterized protein CTRU02_209207 [Colletotrichum truncatum]|uniref:Uncharacterized protein n=1 Tax=Colletotrichum truncatum TaxID=5467 RepID=A0ACC3YYE4_COLTU|nr:uncharacterized protein CTRU02_15322 [Colletotrichum truncatum]KAF6781167.1 hypothetical protein CTRU02_15322 [Colletotrichum truncatum]
MSSALYRQAFRAAVGRTARPLSANRLISRSVATKQASPGASSNVREPISSDPESQTVNKARGLDSENSPDSASLAKPVSNPENDKIGLQEEPQPSQENMKNDPNAPAAQKRANVEKEGKKPLDPADKP